ncbi:MAG: DUF2325 domain-containing protein [Oscillospiraceae bacterium]|jgi:hypothetical protein|nr:DUF2325 domain-containing protein [Oscillospiraceae bacterium]
MSVVIIGGHDRMVGRYRDICREYDYTSKVYTQSKTDMEGLIGNPDLIVLFTNPVSHEMVKIAKKVAARREITLIQSHCGSANALKTILEAAIGGVSGGAEK